jgi:hypothetical protein
MRRQILVLGASLAGKSTFARILVERYHLLCVPVDPVIEAFESVFPEHGITHAATDHKSHIKVCGAFSPFLFKMIDGLMEEYDHVVEGFRMDPDRLSKRYGKTHQIFAFGYPGISVEEKFNIVRKHDKDNWTNPESDASLKKTLHFLINESRWLERRCRILKIPYFDTGVDFWKGIEKALSLVI